MRTLVKNGLECGQFYFLRATDQTASSQCVSFASANGGLAEQTHYQLVVHVGKVDQRTIGVGEGLAVSLGPD